MASSPTSVARDTPTDEPRLAGFTKRGSPRSATAARMDAVEVFHQVGIAKGQVADLGQAVGDGRILGHGLVHTQGRAENA